MLHSQNVTSPKIHRCPVDTSRDGPPNHFASFREENYFFTPGRNRTPMHSNAAPSLVTVLPDLSCLQEMKSLYNVIIDVSRIYNENLLPIE
jgi:hypothetical protein